MKYDDFISNKINMVAMEVSETQEDLYLRLYIHL